MRIFSLLTLAAASICLTAAGADYFVSPKGDDKAAGSKASPWRSIERVNQTQLNPGGRILVDWGQPAGPGHSATQPAAGRMAASLARRKAMQPGTCSTVSPWSRSGPVKRWARSKLR